MRQLGLNEQELDYVLAYTGYMESSNWVASCVTELDDTLPWFTDVQWDSVRATHGVSTEAYAWKTTLGWGRTQHDSLTMPWTVATPGALLAHVCRVVRFIPLHGWLLIWISVTPSDMGDGLFAAPKHSNSTFIMLYLVHDMDIDYLVVDEMINISILFDYTCMLRIGCKHIMLIT
jgi:hypothetical protein